MDFPVCPACHQSVIDDDAVDCPFCGASMKGKPSPKSTPKTAAKTSTSTVKAPAKQAPSPKPTGGKSSPSGPTLPGDDFPFDIELTSGKSAIPAMPNPTKQRSWKVICPMCDTPGYLPASAAGQDVRCANTKCVMPVFTAPVPKKKEEAPLPKPKSSFIPKLIGITIVLGLAIGGGIYAFTFLGQGKKEVSDEARELMRQAASGKPKAAGQNDANKAPDGINANPAVDGNNAEFDIEALTAEVLSQMEIFCLEKANNRSKIFCRQLAAEANAVLGNSGPARKHLDQLLKLPGGKDSSYYRIVPLLDLFWADFAAGGKNKFSDTLGLALSEVPKIPKNGRTQYDIAGRLATALVAVGRMSDATAALANVHSADADAQLSARLQIATDGTVDVFSDTFSVLPWKFPQPVATTASLMHRGLADAALKWAESQTDEDAKVECLAYWAEKVAGRKAANGTVDPGGIIAAAITDLPPVLSARVWARAGCGRLSANDPEGVAAAIKLAVAQLTQVGPPPAPPVVPEIKKTIKFSLPKNDELHFQAATATGEIAFLQAQSKSSIDDAEKSLDLAMQFVDATAPSLAATQKRYQETVDDFRELKDFRAFIKKALVLRTDDEARAQSSEYKDALTGIVNAAQQRYDVEQKLLTRLRGAGIGLNSKVWIIVNSRATSDDINKRDDFFTKELAGELIEGLKGTDEASAVLGAWRLKDTTPPPRPVSVELNERLQSEKNIAEAVHKVQAIGRPRSDELFFQSASRLAATDKWSTAFKFIPLIADGIVREDCYRLAAAIATKRNQAKEVWEEVAKVPQQTEKISISRGLIAGLQASEN